MSEMINTFVNNLVSKIMEYGYSALHFIVCGAVVVLGLILIVRFARTWVQRGIITAVCVALLIAAPYICKYLLVPFFGKLLQTLLTVSVYCIVAIGPILLLAKWIWTSFTKHL